MELEAISCAVCSKKTSTFVNTSYGEICSIKCFDKLASDILGASYDDFKKEGIRPIRSTVAAFETQEEIDELIAYADSTDKDNRPEMSRMREELRNHTISKRRGEESDVSN